MQTSNLYFVSTKAPSFWNKSLSQLLNCDMSKLSQEQNTVLLYKLGQVFGRRTPRSYKIYQYAQSLLDSIIQTGELGGFVILKNVYCKIRRKDNIFLISLFRDQCNLYLESGPESLELQDFIISLSQNCILETCTLYNIVSTIGTGATSEVFLAETQDHCKFALKRVKKIPYTNKLREKAAKSLAEEIFVLRRISHPNIPTLHKVFESENYVDLVMTYYEGPHLLDKTPYFSLTQKQQLVKELIETMAYVHSLNIMHRDLKPQNIVYKDSDKYSYDFAIIDFGFATNVKYTEQVLSNCGTPGYAAPEIMEYKEKQKMYKTKCDVFSLGVIIYEIFYNSHPFKNGNLQNSLCFDDKIYVPQSLKNLIIQMTRINPKQRFNLTQCLDQNFFKEKFDDFHLDFQSDNIKLCDSINPSQQYKSINMIRKCSLEQFDPNQKTISLKNKTNASTADSKIMQKSILDQQLFDLQFNDEHNFPKDFGLTFLKKI